MAKDKEPEDKLGNAQEDRDVPCHYEPLQNSFEKAKWNSNGYNQSGMKGK